MNEWEALLRVLEISVKRNGEKPLTNKWLLNCMYMVERSMQQHEDTIELYENMFESE